MYQPAVKRLFEHLQPSQVPNVASLLAQALKYLRFSLGVLQRRPVVSTIFPVIRRALYLSRMSAAHSSGKVLEGLESNAPCPSHWSTSAVEVRTVAGSRLRYPPQSNPTTAQF
jgi:hypothetical protein